MDKVKLGRTELDVSVACLGAGGHSRLGLKKGYSETQAADVVRAAIDHGINLIDTAPVYGTESAVGAGIQGRRDDIVISTKMRVVMPGTSYEGTDFIAPHMVRSSLEASLKALRTDRVEILHLHGVRRHQYRFSIDHLVPELSRLKEEGKVGHLGITEAFGVDLERQVLQQAVSDGIWDVLMLGYNFVNPSAAELILQQTQVKRLGTMCMYAVRGVLADATSLCSLVKELVQAEEVDPADIDPDHPLGFLLEEGVARTYTEAAYRFCRHTAGIDVVMTGTSSMEHLRENIAAINAGPLPPDVLKHLNNIFRRVRTATGDPSDKGI